MRLVAFITQTSVIDQILTYLRTRAAHATHAGARSPPATRAVLRVLQHEAPAFFSDVEIYGAADRREAARIGFHKV